MNVPFVDLKAEYKVIAREVGERMGRVMENADFILGEDVHLFEQEFASYCGARFGVGLDNGTSALELALRAYGIGEGDEVITVANTFIATASAVAFTGARPVLVDIDAQTYNIDVRAIERAITARTKAIIPVHLYGQTADMDPILDLAQAKKLVVIEDACQAHGALYKGGRAGSIGDVGCFSFYPAKNLGCYGDGGLLVTNNEEIADKVRMLRNYGQKEKYYHQFIAYNRRLDTLQAAVLRAKLPRLDEWNESRHKAARIYGQLLAHTDVTAPMEASYGRHVYHVYVVRGRNRDGLRAYLQSRGISTGIHYPVPIHMQEAYRYLGHRAGDFPVTEQYASQILSLPMHPFLSEEQIEYVAHTIADYAP